MTHNMLTNMYKAAQGWAKREGKKHPVDVGSDTVITNEVNTFCRRNSLLTLRHCRLRQLTRSELYQSVTSGLP